MAANNEAKPMHPPQPRKPARKTIAKQEPKPMLSTQEVEGDSIASETHRPLVSPYLQLRLWSEMYQDAMQTRIAATNRAERAPVDKDHYAIHIKLLGETEQTCAAELVGAYRRVVPQSVREWQDASPGVGEHLLARLLGIIGDPRLATPYHWEGHGKDSRRLVADEPYQRSISQLWSYCGVGDPERKRKRGQPVEEAMACGIPLAKSVLYLLALSCVKVNRGPYRDHYDAAREKYADRVHKKDCPACGPAGKPAKEGSPWAPAHQHAAALRKVSKEILRDLWISAS